jgi:hypothetical protein
MSASLWQRAYRGNPWRALGWLLQGDELGYFAFGGSTVIAVFARKQIAIDEDLLHNRCVLPYEANTGCPSSMKRPAIYQHPVAQWAGWLQGRIGSVQPVS